MALSRPIHFEIHAEKPERAAEFYKNLFGWTIEKWQAPEGVDMDYWMVMTGNADPRANPNTEMGIDGGLMIRHGSAPVHGAPVNAYVCTMGVPSVDEYVAKAISLGGTLSLPKMPIKGMGWLAYCTDTEGNIFGMMEMDTNAA